ncbi:hypothetical protein ACA689_004138 [Vibrio vulnificus]|uniref:Chemotaxis methyl-accepting receptor HlyB-like 4HB MCP domain-containing protein n=1 Tax=Vibrio vulnificus TaxID=672 RepID=A0AAW4HEP4_VIBVL|nr:hypothetical protein [Vibrio vulnificus]EJU9868638.1 hypothetical protein [Vibrio vulnificus]ELA3118156.1 hypothetical protein [Vibrio vulnificus]ELL0561813.1 hypothetical protein [Vibrio vulnificus]MBN8124637.1 hypothetical protein [Vibrio vulnificus]
MKQWYFAVLGSLLILGSSAISGIYISGKEDKSVSVSSKIMDLRGNMSRAETANYYALISSDLAEIQRNIVKFSMFQDPRVQDERDKLHATSIYPVILNLMQASGMSLDGESTAGIVALLEEVENGSKDAYKELRQIVPNLIKQSGQYRSDLVIKIAALENEKNLISNSISTAKQVAIFMQLAGLVLLLVKESPVERWSRYITKR